MLGLQNQSRWRCPPPPPPPQSNPVLIRPPILGQAGAQGEADCVTMAALYKTITLCTPPIIDIGIIQRHRAARYNIYTGETLVPPLNPPVSVVIEADMANLSSVHTPCLPYTYFVSLHQCVHTTCLPYLPYPPCLLLCITSTFIQSNNLLNKPCKQVLLCVSFGALSNMMCS